MLLGKFENRRFSIERERERERVGGRGKERKGCYAIGSGNDRNQNKFSQ